MLYKTMVLELLQQRPEVHEQLRRQRMVLPVLNYYAGELKSLHEAWQQHLAETRPGTSPNQTASEALEIALKEIKDCLPSAPSQPDSAHPSVEDLMAFLRDPTPPA